MRSTSFEEISHRHTALRLLKRHVASGRNLCSYCIKAPSTRRLHEHYWVKSSQNFTKLVLHRLKTNVFVLLHDPCKPNVFDISMTTNTSGKTPIRHGQMARPQPLNKHAERSSRKAQRARGYRWPEACSRSNGQLLCRLDARYAGD